MVNEYFQDRVMKKYGSWESSMDSNVLYFYKFIGKFDRGIVNLLKDLNSSGCHTVFSCSGHSKDDFAYIDFASYVTKEKIYREMDRLFDCDRFSYELSDTKFPNGVTLVRMVIPASRKSRLGVVSCPKEFSNIVVSSD